MYSTLAQTAGALVGLLGAVLISRVLSHMSGLYPQIHDIRQKIHNLLLFVYSDRVTIKGRVNDLRFGPEGVEWIAMVDKCYERFEQELVGEVNRNRVSEHVALLTECSDKFPKSANDTLRSNDTFQRTLAQFKLLQEKLSEFDAQLVPRSFWLVFWLLAYLSVVGVGLPLLALALLADDAPWLMIALTVGFEVGVAALVAYFLYLFRELSGLARFQWRHLT
jgi:hypothetical protein